MLAPHTVSSSLCAVAESGGGIGEREGRCSTCLVHGCFVWTLIPEAAENAKVAVSARLGLLRPRDHSGLAAHNSTRTPPKTNRCGKFSTVQNSTVHHSKWRGTDSKHGILLLRVIPPILSTTFVPAGCAASSYHLMPWQALHEAKIKQVCGCSAGGSVYSRVCKQICRSIIVSA